MNFLNPIFIIGITTGPILLLAGLIMLYKPPKKINDFYGYRTKQSMKNQAHWDFAQEFSSQKLIQSGFYYSLSALPFLFFEVGEVSAIIVSIILLVVFIGYPLYTTEKALKEKFNSK